MSAQRSQLWPHMALVGVIACVMLSAALISTTWQWIGPDWGSFAQHWPSLRSALWGLLTRNPQPWLSYWQWAEQYDLQVALMLHLALPVLVAAAAAIALASLLYVPGGRDPAHHINGPRLFAGRTAYRHARAAYQQELHGDAMGPGVSLHPSVSIPMRRELLNVLVEGQQGSGKGVVIKPLVGQAIGRGDRIMIYDQKREYTPLFLTEQAVLISPSDKRSRTWDIADDAQKPEDALRIAEQLIVAEGHQEPFWAQGARLILAGCMCILTGTRRQRWGWPELRDVLMLPETELLDGLAKHYPSAARLIKDESKTTAGFLMTITAKLGWVDTLAKAWPDRSRPFSVRRWIAYDTAPKVVIIANDPRYSAMSGPLCTALLSLMTAEVLALEDSDSRRIWFALDELGNLPKCPPLLTWLSLGRSKGARTLAGFQSMSQLRELYGDNGAETLLGLFSNVIALRCGASGGSSEAVAQAFGKRIVERPVVTINHLGQRSTTYQRSDPEPVIRPDDVVQLPQASNRSVQGFLSIGGWSAVYRLRWPYPRLPVQAADYVPADWLIPTAKPAARRRNQRRV